MEKNYQIISRPFFSSLTAINVLISPGYVSNMTNDSTYKHDNLHVIYKEETVDLITNLADGLKYM